MLPMIKTTVGIALLLTLSACASSATKEKTPSLTSITPLDGRAEADYQFIMGDLLSREGKSAKAAEHFEKVAALDPAAAVYVRLSAEYQKIDKLEEAIVNAQKALEKDPKNLTAMLYLGSLYANTNDLKKAEQYFNALLNNPNYETPYLVHYYMGVMYSDQKGTQYATATENAFKKALKLKPNFEDALIGLANLYLKQNHSAKALALCSDYQTRQGYSRNVADMIAQINIDKGDLDKAYGQLDYISGKSEGSLDAEMKMALILIKSKRIQPAIAKLNEIIAKYPDADSARYYLAAVYEQNGSADNAIREYMLVPPSSAHSSEAIAHAAYLLKEQGKINQALALTTQELKIKSDPQVYMMHASLLDAKSDYLGAAKSLEEALKKYSQNTEILFQHAIMLDRLGKKEAMIAQMKKVLEIAPDHVQSMSYLAFTMAEQNQNLAEAERLARHASELAPQDGYVLDTLGWVLFKQKKFTESIKVLEKAYAYQPSADIIAKHLADAYSSMRSNITSSSHSPADL